MAREYSKKELKTIRRETRKQALRDIDRVHRNITAHKPWWLPRFIWVRMVMIVLNPERTEKK